MNDDDFDDLPEPEHEHLLDHEFDDPHEAAEHDATGLQDEIDEEGEWDDEEDSDAHWHDD